MAAPCRDGGAGGNQRDRMIPDVYSITMAAGTSSRMPPELRPKACCRVGSISVIESALRTYEQAGIRRHVIVIGGEAERIMAETSGRRGVLFCYQAQARGTGDAVRTSLEFLEGVDTPEHILICAGDKVIAPHIVRGLMETYAASEADLCLVAGRAEDHPDSGRIVQRDGHPCAIIEVPDIRTRQLAACLCSLRPAERPQSAGDLMALAARYIRKPEKLARQFPALGRYLNIAPNEPVAWEHVLEAARAIPEGFDLPVGHVSTEEAAGCAMANLSVYVGRFQAIREAVEKLRSDNVQGEWYFTDIVQILAAAGRRVEMFQALKAEEVMAFNTVEELEHIRRVYAHRSATAVKYPAAGEWINYLEGRSGGAVPGEAVRGLAEVVGADRPCVIVRSPGRINLMGRHVDHQGGMCNLMAIDREIVIAVAPRDDDRINVSNADSKGYPPRTFTFGELTADIVWENWLHTLDTQYVRRLVNESAGDWVNYVKGAALRLQHRFRDRRLRGMDVFVTGNVPPGAGLSSSSALVVAVAEALVEINGLNVGIREFVDLCGEGEWFVGTRGGAADHAAIKFSRTNQVLSVSFFPFEVVQVCPFPEDCRIVICNSGIQAKKTESARGRFNARVACYHMAREVIRAKFPQFADRIQHLRDINVRTLDISLSALYALIKHLPNSVEPAEVQRLAEQHPTVAKCVTGLDVTQHDFPLRDVALYGLAECERAREIGRLLQQGDMAALGEMMALSHDGDRVATWRPTQAAFAWTATDEHMDRLIQDAQGLQPLSNVSAALWQQVGAYACSTPEIDLMVDRVLETPGVLGAQLAGAGLGGCIMVLVRKDAAEAVREALRQDYYAPRGIEPAVFVCKPSAGSQVMTAI